MKRLSALEALNTSYSWRGDEILHTPSNALVNMSLNIQKLFSRIERQEALFQDFSSMLLLKGVGPSEVLVVQKEKSIA